MSAMFLGLIQHSYILTVKDYNRSVCFSTVRHSNCIVGFLIVKRFICIVY